MFSRRSRRPQIAVRVLAGLVVLLIGVWLGGHPGWIPASIRSAFVDEGGGRLTSQVLSTLARDYYRPVDTTRLADEGLAAIVASLNDPYSHYYDASAYHAFLEQSNPHLSGIGIDPMPEPRGLRVVDVFADSPAARAGLQRGDLIVAVGSSSLAGRPWYYGAGLIRGRAGTPVTLTVMRGSRQLVVRIVRANMVVPVATGEILSYHGVRIGDLTLTSFTAGSGAELRSQVRDVMRSGAQALVLDLRENGGGLLDEAVNVGSLFIPDGTIVTTDGRSQPRQVYVAKGGAIAAKIPMVVLVDRGTASASEIVTGALRDRGRAKVVGTRTYGKGVFQEIEPLPNGGALDITVGEYFTPNGTNLGGGGVREGAGISPDVYAVDNPHTARDEALQTAERTVAAELR
ncbi:MAG: S41 family peptidase [Solirubrobacterales bacterium]|nr:S41 family peptidase [Solirubrobacterales bacterium]MBV9713776.1 S41 family peptidase [Solirubrobacterales bacterium]